LVKRQNIIVVFLIGIALISLIFNYVIASDNDEDGIEDEFEELNKRDIDIEIEADKIQIESSLRSGDIKDEIQLKITNDSEGLSIEVGYESEISSENITLVDLEFGIIFRKLIEFVDSDENGIYDPFVDVTIQEFNFTDFQPVKYTQISISDDTKLHYFVVNTTNGVFTAHIYFSEEFHIINGTLVTPVQTKIDIQISNFPHINSSSQIALYTSLESENDYNEEEDTEDEILDYATNEKGVISEMNNLTGIFTWKNNATIDGFSKAILMSSLDIDDYDGDEQRLYLNYPRGTHIYHDPKVGIAGIYKINIINDNPLFLIILLAIISSLSISIGYGVYHYRERIFTGYSSELEKEKSIIKSQSKLRYYPARLGAIIDNKRLLHHLKDLHLDKNQSNEDMKVTAFSKDFFEIINKFEWEEDDLIDFIREITSLTPEERRSVLEEMIDKSEQQTKNRLDDTKRLYT